jgi:hypothetical protein
VGSNGIVLAVPSSSWAILSLEAQLIGDSKGLPGISDGLWPTCVGCPMHYISALNKKDGKKSIPLLKMKSTLFLASFETFGTKSYTLKLGFSGWVCGRGDEQNIPCLFPDDPELNCRSSSALTTMSSPFSLPRPFTNVWIVR